MIFFTVNHTQQVMSEEPTVFFKNETIDWDRSFNVLWNLQKKKKIHHIQKTIVFIKYLQV
jgi:hypothetical protein